MAVTTAVFKIDGRHQTQLARSLVLDGDWRDGLQLLLDGFEGMSHDFAFQLLKGTHTLVGVNNDITMIEELDEEYQKQVHEMYCEDRFFEMNELYSFVKFIDHTVIHDDIVYRGLNYKIPASDEYVRKYLLPDDMFVFEATPFGKHYRGLIAEKLDRNTLPLWLTKADFCTTAKAYANKYHPAPVIQREPVKAIEPKPVAVAASHDDVHRSNNDWHDSWRASKALQIAQDHGFSTAIDFSIHLRVNVLNAVKERGCTWKTIDVNHADVNESVTFPYELALSFALSRTGLSHLAPAWEPVSPHDLKMSGDNRRHTDLWLALGFNLDGREYNYSTREHTLFSAVVSAMQREVFPMGEFDTLNSAGLDSFTGSVVTPTSELIGSHDVLIIPNAGPEYDVLARKAGLVICETGSRMAHLAVVGREFGLPLIRIADAGKKFKEGITLNIDFKTNTITAHS